MAWEIRYFGPTSEDPGVVKMIHKNRGECRSDHYFIPLPLTHPQVTDRSEKCTVEYLEDGLVTFPIGIKMRGTGTVDQNRDYFGTLLIISTFLFLDESMFYVCEESIRSNSLI